MFRSVVSRLSGHPASRAPRAVRTFLPGCERLEDRCVPANLSIQPAHTYDFNGSLADEQAGPAMIAEGGTLQGGRYVFAPNQGLLLKDALADTQTYSVTACLSINSLTTNFYKKLIDFSGGHVDPGVYVTGSLLQFYPYGAGPTDVVANTDFLLILTQDGSTGVTKVYLDNVLQQTYTGNIAVPWSNLLIFFEDDGKGGEAVGGSVDYIATFNGVLTAQDVATLASSSLGVTANQMQVTVSKGQTATNSSSWGGNGIEPVKLTASSGKVIENADGTWSWSLPTSDGPDDSRTVTITATDSDGASRTTSFALVVNNVAPSVAPGAGSVTVAEGSAASKSGTWSDPGNDIVTLAASVGSVVKNADGTWSWNYANAAGSQTVVITATDSDGASSTASFNLTATSTASLQFTALTSSTPSLASPSADGVVKVEGTFANAAGPVKARVNWGDGSAAEALRMDQNAFQGNHHYRSGGVFVVTVTLTDASGAAASKITTAVVRGVGVVDGVLYVVGSQQADEIGIELVKGREEFYRVEVRLGVGRDARTEVFNVRKDQIDRVMVVAGTNDHVRLGKGVTADVETVPATGPSPLFGEAFRYLLQWLAALRHGK